MLRLNGVKVAEFVPEIADNLTTDDSTKALSAKQGKVLNDNLGSQLFFGANDGQHYSSNKTTVDAIIDDVVQVSSGDTHGYFSVQNVGNITGYGNRQFLFGWINSQKNYGWVLIATYNNKISFGTRVGSSTFSIREL